MFVTRTTGWHTPEAHAPPWQSWPHAPQFFGSFCVSAQTPLQWAQSLEPSVSSGARCTQAPSGKQAETRRAKPTPRTSAISYAFGSDFERRRAPFESQGDKAMRGELLHRRHGSAQAPAHYRKATGRSGAREHFARLPCHAWERCTESANGHVLGPPATARIRRALPGHPNAKIAPCFRSGEFS
jgi:hypothetical protein